MKNIVFCADGTWNGPDEDDDKDGVPDNTNVLKLYFNLAGQDTLGKFRLSNEQEREERNGQGEVVQIAKYLHGVGDSNNWLKKLLGGGFGMGVIARIVRGYTFISRNYQPGDKIFLIGFSRGAYTARALGGLITGQGLLNPDTVDLSNKENAHSFGIEAWQIYRKRVENTPMEFRPLVKLAEAFATLPGFFSRELNVDDFVSATVEGIGVWDTVGAMGIPVFHNGEQKDLFRFVNNDLHPDVHNGLHLVSLDERRGDFAPTLWNPRARVKQILLPGAHADVGGGYPVKGNQSGLSDGGLECMSQWCSKLGVRFSETPSIIPKPDPVNGVAHEPWNDPPFNVMPQRIRQFPLDLHICLHQSVVDRWQAKEVVANPGEDPAPYRPKNLTAYLDAKGDPSQDKVCDCSP